MPIIFSVVRMRRGLVAVVAAAFVVPMFPGTAAAAPVDLRRAPQKCAEAQNFDAEAPWPRAMLAADSVWPFTRGSGTVVAVLPTGVDGTQPQLRGRVLDGFDAVANRAGANSDCTGTGTQVAGVIAAEPSTGNGVVGLAPTTTIQPVRVVSDDNSSTVEAQPGPLARGLTWAAEHDADVIVVAAPVRTDDPAVRQAVADAATRGIIVVAAVGDLGSASDSNPTPYPAAYPDVLGVGAIAANGQVWEKSQHGDYVDLVAPGAAVPTLQRGNGLAQADGTALAAGYVGAAAALVRSKRSDLVGLDVATALIATASPAPLGTSYGAGVVNPYAAVTSNVAAASKRPLPAVAGAPLDDDSGLRRRQGVALAGAMLAGIAVIAAVLFTAAARLGRRQGWHPGLAPAPEETEEPLEPGPPVMLLDEPADTR